MADGRQRSGGNLRQMPSRSYMENARRWGFPWKNLDEALEYMKELGVEIVRGPVQTESRYPFSLFHDPDGVNA